MSQSEWIPVATDQDANVAEEDLELVEWPGGPITFSGVGTWAGGSASLQYRMPDGATYKTKARLTEDDYTRLEWMPPGTIRVIVEGASTIVSCWVLKG